MQQHKFPRKKGRFLVEFNDSGGNHRMSFTRDLSLDGFFVISDQIPRQNEAIIVRLHGTRGKVLELPGKVVRIGRSSAAGGTAVATGFAFHISGLNDDYMALVDALRA